MKNASYSKEHLRYLAHRRNTAVLVWCMRVGILILLLGIWELLARFEIVNPFITSSPSRIAVCLADLYQNGNLFYHIGTTLWETLLGFAIAVVIGFTLALILWWNETARRIFEPYIVVLNALPKIALGPLIIVWFGTGSKSIVFMTILVAVIVSTMNMLNGFLATDKGKLLLLRSMGASKLQQLLKLVIPSSLPAVFSMLKVCVGLAWIGSIMGEYIVSKAGLGYLIVYGGQVFKLDLVMTATIVLCTLAGLMYAVVAIFEQLCIRHRTH